MFEHVLIDGSIVLLINAGFPFWMLDAAVVAAAMIAWSVVLYISYRTVGYVRIEFLGHQEKDLPKYQRLTQESQDE